MSCRFVDGYISSPSPSSRRVAPPSSKRESPDSPAESNFTVDDVPFRRLPRPLVSEKPDCESQVSYAEEMKGVNVKAEGTFVGWGFPGLQYRGDENEPKPGCKVTLSGLRHAGPTVPTEEEEIAAIKRMGKLPARITVNFNKGQIPNPGNPPPNVPNPKAAPKAMRAMKKAVPNRINKNQKKPR